LRAELREKKIIPNLVVVSCVIIVTIKDEMRLMLFGRLDEQRAAARQ
ncbi:unnamed protein product, partial [Rotaria magnacalcarata]